MLRSPHVQESCNSLHAQVTSLHALDARLFTFSRKSFQQVCQQSPERRYAWRWEHTSENLMFITGKAAQDAADFKEK